MAQVTAPGQSGTVSIARWALAVLAALFTLGALGQFFLVGLSMFEDGARWRDHQTLGHVIGMLPWVMWMPALIGRAGRRLISATVLLFILFELQYAFINIDSGIANAFHPLNGSILLVLGVWICHRSIALVRVPALPSHDRTDSIR